MFGEEKMFGQAELNVDYKNRIIIPAFTKREEGDTLILVENKDLGIYEIYSMDYIGKIHDSINEKIAQAKTKKELINLELKVYKMSKLILRSGKLDKQGKFNLGEKFKGTSKINILGAGDHLILELKK